MHGHSFIGDQLSSVSGQTVRAVSPLNSATIEPPFCLATESDVDAALSLAEEAFVAYRETTGDTRARFLERIADEIVALGDDLITRAHQETGLPQARLT